MRRIVFLGFLILFFSCKEKLIKEPENLIPKDKMAAIYYDLAIVTSAKNTNKQVLVTQGIETMNYIYLKHDIDSLQFVESDVYYASNPLIYKEIYQKAETRLKAEVKELDDAKKEQRKLDSIARVKELTKPIDSLVTN
ncbi:DUF4296 domain-containing protein [Cellulophaga sp. Hel_I_12]|uniref:DUF4296 domain-containing protein n=1 Tax=Cellulophaga sp. Hel_I_12 TaxID=1249972 RepID=UPI000691F96E|nr:DUF4296 domain-containing protein [Cellulophaga sp. Hel_I_12]